MTQYGGPPNLDPTTITMVLALNGIDPDSADGIRLEAALRAREDHLADSLRLTAVEQFGLEPAIVAEVLTQLGMGTAPSTEARLAIHNNFHATLERLRREHGNG